LAISLGAQGEKIITVMIFCITDLVIYTKRVNTRFDFLEYEIVVKPSEWRKW